MSASFHVGTQTRLICLDPASGTYAVILARPPLEPSLATFTNRRLLSACVTHEYGLAWPDQTGQQLAAVTLERGGAVILTFTCLGDAMACKLRLSREAEPA